MNMYVCAHFPFGSGTADGLAVVYIFRWRLLALPVTAYAEMVVGRNSATKYIGYRRPSVPTSTADMQAVNALPAKII